MQSRLRPLGAGELVDTAVAIYRRNFASLLGVTAFVVVPAQVLVLLVSLSTLPDGATTDPLGFGDLTAEPSDEDAAVTLAGGVVTVLITFLSGLLAVATCVRLCIDAYAGRPTSARQSLRAVRSRLPAVLGAAALASVLLLLGYFLCIVPAIWLGVAWSAVMPAVVLEQASPGRSLARSFDLVRGRWWATFGVVLVALLLTQVLELGVALPLTLAFGFGDFAGSVAAQGVVGIGAALLTTPILAATIAIVYADLRVRKEGFDLQLRLQELPEPPAVAPAGPASR